MKKPKFTFEEEGIRHIPSYVFSGSSSTLVPSKLECIPSDLRVDDFSLDTLIEGNATDLLRPVPQISGSNIEQSDSFTRVAVDSRSQIVEPNNENV